MFHWMTVVDVRRHAEGKDIYNYHHRLLSLFLIVCVCVCVCANRLIRVRDKHDGGKVLTSRMYYLKNI